MLQRRGFSAASDQAVRADGQTTRAASGRNFSRAIPVLPDLSCLTSSQGGEDNRALKPHRARIVFRLAIVSLGLAAWGSAGRFCAARDHVDNLDDGQAGWALMPVDKTAATLVRHLRTNEIHREGRGAELFEVSVSAPVAILQLGYQLPAAQLIDDLKFSIWFQANQDGATLAVRVVFPNQPDPDTGTNLTVLIDGEVYKKTGQWQKLECTGLKGRLDRLLPQLRRKLQLSGALKHDIDRRGVYIDAAFITIHTSRGSSQFVIDDLRFGPIVDAAGERRIQPAEHALPAVVPEAEFRLDRLYVRGAPSFPRFIPYRGEQPADLARMRFTVAWIPDYQDVCLLEELDHIGLRAMAVPPRLASEEGRPLEPSSAHLLPFGRETSPILFWYLGTHIPAEKKQEVADWQEQIRSADRSFKRPLMGDVSALERTYSRHLEMIGASRSPVHSSFGFKNYRDWLIERRNLARPGSFFFTWIQTEPSPSVEETRHAAGWNPQVIEPEQLRLELYAALAAGCRAVGFWTHSSLDDDRPGALERKLMVALLNMELELLEPLLATGNLSGQTPFTAVAPVARNPKGASSPLAHARGPRLWEAALNDREVQNRKQGQLKNDLEAPVISTALGTLVLPIWYGNEAQYVPGQMAANDAKIVVPGAGQSARAWEISTTRIHELASERVAGGKEVTLPKFDLTAAILFTADETLIERFIRKMEALREPSARVALELARAKFDRVAAVDLELHRLGHGQPDAGSILDAARVCLDRAEAELQSQRYHESRLQSADALQHLRNLQYIYWSDAAHRLRAAVSSPHTLCFQTLPDHWRMIVRFGRTLNSNLKNLLRSGDFEDRDTMVAEGWLRKETAIEGVRSTAELNPRAHTGTYALRLAAVPATGKDPPLTISERPVTVVSPPITVYKGQLVYIGGWVKIDAPSRGNLDGAMLYDSLCGPAAALRWRTVGPWQKFELVREVHETCELTLTMALSGLGEIRFDDLEVILLDVDSNPAARTIKNSAPAGHGGPFDFLKNLPGIKGKSE